MSVKVWTSSLYLLYKFSVRLQRSFKFCWKAVTSRISSCKKHKCYWTAAALQNWVTCIGGFIKLKKTQPLHFPKGSHYSFILIISKPGCECYPLAFVAMISKWLPCDNYIIIKALWSRHSHAVSLETWFQGVFKDLFKPLLSVHFNCPICFTLQIISVSLQARYVLCVIHSCSINFSL